jgi:hypothetical protein
VIKPIQKRHTSISLTACGISLPFFLPVAKLNREQQNEPPRSKLSGYLIINLSPPLMIGGDQGEGEASNIPALHPHLTFPIKGEESIK